ncbi:type IV toxin-antitoxin system AbiEi family antitoxin domain-containing protein [Microbacterium esteraromaticum]|uniref:type IV toxin-antitoxin system AbiEi family antitoxin domain-containing protein n=1 Tax=Microbacterium esteraromaticum TaxID=57043 RepID=UPI0019D3C24C|nr:type IV toxin-antitoxin system AbiEi family antitoxin domain-containing protein [Microbacterium esteraromaticum]MBN7793951.1 hypothetical protein [Microbacterium esteraromaticum]
MPVSKPTVAQRLADLQRIRIYSRADLFDQGLGARGITSAVRAGRLFRLRRGHYVTHQVPDDIADAVHTGGRIGCVTLLHLIGVFVLEKPAAHVHVSPQLSRSRHRRPRSATMHWSPCREPGTAHAVSVWDAVRESIRCQAPRAAIATVDSVLHHRLLTREQIVGIFRSLPARFQALLPLVDASAESGPETFVRLMLRALGVPFETQVTLVGVGRVDFVVDGWLIIECDSREFHEGWDQQVEDRARDLMAAQLGYVTIRPIAADIFNRPDRVRAAITDVIAVLGPLFERRRRSQLRRNGRSGGA